MFGTSRIIWIGDKSHIPRNVGSGLQQTDCTPHGGSFSFCELRRYPNQHAHLFIIVKHFSSSVITALNVAIRQIALYSAGFFLSSQTKHKTSALAPTHQPLPPHPPSDPVTFTTHMYPLIATTPAAQPLHDASGPDSLDSACQ